MKVKFLGKRGSWKEVADSARTTINKEAGNKCNQASEETRNAWKEVLNSIKDGEPELYNVCVPDYIYRLVL